MNEPATDPEELPAVVWEGVFHVFGQEIKCCVLSDGRRIIDAESVERMFDVPWTPHAEMHDPAIAEFAAWLKGKDQ